MLSLILAIAAGIGAWCAVFFGWSSDHWVWATLATLAAFLGVSLLINLLIRKRMTEIFTKVQNSIVSSQDKIRKRIGAMQFKIQNQQKLMEFAEKEQTESIHEAMAMLDEIKPYYKWNILAKRQVNTLKGQLHFQIKEFDEADKCLEKAFIMDPLLLAMQMARMFKKEEYKKLEKAYNKGIGRFKYEKGLLIYAVYAWALVKQGKIDEAIAVLAEGKDKTENPVMKQNWEHLVNNRSKKISFAGLGDQWLALYLENPPAYKPQAQMPFGGRPTRGGFR